MEDAYGHYLSALEAASEIYKADRARGRIAAVKVAVQYLREMKADLTLVAPFYDVIGQLEDERIGRTGNSEFQSANMAMASIAVTFANKAGRNLKQSGAYVAKATGMDAKQLLQHRKNLMDERAPRDEIELYNRLIDAANASGKTAAELAEHTLARLREKMTAKS
ncbi:hypothetical protein ACFQX9_23405 [Bradyrhizobium sp. GCM10028915]|uniref:hypothetical protein n=1 Tax=Bradyrhizobium sp. GCM10028915 TaxID=3273385 RepID=UPI00361FDADF